MRRELMDVGIVGAGRLGQAMARTALRAGRQIVMANSRGPESLASLVSAFGAAISTGRPRARFSPTSSGARAS
jgi:predicted dinucleotide-binding enzyme